jgi:hypothetical protein
VWYIRVWMLMSWVESERSTVRSLYWKICWCSMFYLFQCMRSLMLTMECRISIVNSTSIGHGCRQKSFEVRDSSLNELSPFDHWPNRAGVITRVVILSWVHLFCRPYHPTVLRSMLDHHALDDARPNTHTFDFEHVRDDIDSSGSRRSQAVVEYILHPNDRSYPLSHSPPTFSHLVLLPRRPWHCDFAETMDISGERWMSGRH